MHHDSEIVPLEVNTIIAESKPMQYFPRAFQFPEPLQVSAHDFLRQTPKFPENVKLKFPRHFSQFGGADGIEDDLELDHRLVARTGIAPVFQP